MNDTKMNLTEFTEKFQSLFDDTDLKFVPSSKFKECAEWNSLRALYLIAMIDTEFGVPFDTNDLRNSGTVEDIFRIVQAKLS